MAIYDRDFSKIYKRKEVPEKIKRKYQNKFHHTQIDLTENAMPFNNVITEIAKTQKIRRKDVELILNNYIAIMKREILQKGTFRIPNVLSVTSQIWNGNGDKIERVPNSDPPIFINPPTTVRLKVKMLPSFKAKYRWARRYEECIAFKLAVEDWYKPFIIETPEYLQKAIDKWKDFDKKKKEQKE